MESVHLSGAEDVSRAGSRISSAADTMSRAASSIDGSIENFFRQLDERLARLESLVERIEAASGSKV